MPFIETDVRKLDDRREKLIDNELIFVSDVSIEVPPESKTGAKRLTEDEDNEYHQIQGNETTLLI